VIAQRRGLRVAAVSVACAIAGACVGGAIMWRLGRDHPERVAELLDYVPAVSREMIEAARPAIAEAPFLALVKGAFSGVPYKVFGGVAASAGVPLGTFLLITIPARAVRFLLLCGLSAAANSWLAPRIGLRTRTLLLIGGWTVFYVLYWSLKEG
jgi:membrane protein YqaA with SNARE-associated domain